MYGCWAIFTILAFVVPALHVKALTIPLQSRNDYAAPSFDVPVMQVPSTVTDGAFPADFAFGVSTSAYQIEGAWLEDGKGFSVWNTFSHIPGQIENGDTGDIAADFYHKFDADLAMMAANGIRHFRMSLSWTRILPTGLVKDGVNTAGIAYYNRVLDACEKYGIDPYVTLFHADMPQFLVQYPRPGIGFLAADFSAIFADYAGVAFAAFGDRVKHWMTFNEPWCSAVLGPQGGSDPYHVAHNILLAHAQAVHLYRVKYQPSQQGRITIVLNTAHFYPANAQSTDDVAAAERSYDFQLAWFLDPLIHGSYPASMVDTVGDRLPSFSDADRMLLKGSIDAIAINHYNPFLCTPRSTLLSTSSTENATYWSDENTHCFNNASWPVNDLGWGIYAPGIRDMLLYVSKRYPGWDIWVSENGVCAPGEDNITVAVNDVMRQQYIHDYVQNVGLALMQGAPVTKYFVWSILDNLEWGSGFSKHFGMVFVSRPDLVRHPKSSLALYQSIISAHVRLQQDLALP
jgi:beta-glucosidase/6-phospho-beta-glucosidase/beta-galactosidase